MGEIVYVSCPSSLEYFLIGNACRLLVFPRLIPLPLDVSEWDLGDGEDM